MVSVCLPSEALLYNTYHLTWVSLTLGVGYLFTAAPAKRSHCSLPCTRGISSPPPFLTFNMGREKPTQQWRLRDACGLKTHLHFLKDCGTSLRGLKQRWMRFAFWKVSLGAGRWIAREGGSVSGCYCIKRNNLWVALPLVGRIGIHTL